MAAHFFDDFHRRAANRAHRERREEERQHAADEQTDERGCLAHVDHLQTRIFLECSEESQTHEACNGDCEALADRSSRVSCGVESIRSLAHFLRKTRHLGDAACVVCDRTECVDRERHAECCKHAHCARADAVELREVIRDAHGDDDDADRQSRRLIAERQPFDEHRGRSRF